MFEAEVQSRTNYQDDRVADPSARWERSRAVLLLQSREILEISSFVYLRPNLLYTRKSELSTRSSFASLESDRPATGLSHHTLLLFFLRCFNNLWTVSAIVERKKSFGEGYLKEGASSHPRSSSPALSKLSTLGRKIATNCRFEENSYRLQLLDELDRSSPMSCFVGIGERIGPNVNEPRVIFAPAVMVFVRVATTNQVRTVTQSGI